MLPFDFLSEDLEDHLKWSAKEGDPKKHECKSNGNITIAGGEELDEAELYLSMYSGAGCELLEDWINIIDASLLF